MENPAKELHSIFVQWNTRASASTNGMNVFHARTSPGKPTEWHEHVVIAMRALVETIDANNALEAAGYTPVPIETVNAWVNAIIAPQSNWGSSNDVTLEMLSSGDLSALSQLGTSLDVIRNQPPTVPAQMRSIERLCDEIESQISSAEMPDRVRAYVEAMLAGVREVLGSGDVTEVVRRLSALVGALKVASADNSTSETTKRNLSRALAKAAKFVGTELTRERIKVVVHQLTT